MQLPHVNVLIYARTLEENVTVQAVRYPGRTRFAAI